CWIVSPNVASIELATCPRGGTVTVVREKGFSNSNVTATGEGEGFAIANIALSMKPPKGFNTNPLTKALSALLGRCPGIDSCPTITPFRVADSSAKVVGAVVPLPGFI